MDQNDHLEKHANILRHQAQEAVVMLKKDQQFPLASPCRVALFGNGARHTIKGGTGSGAVYSYDYNTCERALIASGFEVLTKTWLDAYDIEKIKYHDQFIADIKQTAKEQGVSPFFAGFGKIEAEHDYDIPLSYEGDVCLYVLARNSGEGNDRTPGEGDVFLTKTEIRDITTLSQKFSKFMLVLNVGGVVDLSPVMHVQNILLLSQLGVVTGDTLVDIILGKANPSGKLTTTWAKYADYQTLGDFGDRDDTRYNEGVFVGYRYFDTAQVKPLFPFGFGLSFTDFAIRPLLIQHQRSMIDVQVEVENTGNFTGKEVVEVYVTPPDGSINKPYQSLVGFQKTNEIAPKEKQILTISFNLASVASYFEAEARYILEGGNYVVRVGNSSMNTEVCAVIELTEDVITKQLRNCLGKPDFDDAVIHSGIETKIPDVTTIKLTRNDFDTEVVAYEVDRHINPFVQQMTDDELAHLCLGAHLPDSKLSILGSSAVHIPGASGETTNFLLDKLGGKYLVMVDGPAGIRIAPDYIDTPNGPLQVLERLPEGLWELMPDEVNHKMKSFYDSVPKDRIKHQYTTAIPIGTAVAQSWNKQFAELCGDIVGTEMDIYGIHLWLAPAMNIHRSILCGRNFEYFSEDPLISGIIAAGITNGVQKHKNRGTTIKHFCANNQEFNRNNNNSLVSERALREIYLRGFEICVRESQPHALMTSYNLVNGEHTSQRPDLINDILRCEWGFKGLVMSDWIQSGFMMNPKSKHPTVFAHKLMKAGNDIMMPGVNADFQDIMIALEKNDITRDELLVCATRVYESIQKYN